MSAAALHFPVVSPCPRARRTSTIQLWRSLAIGALAAVATAFLLQGLGLSLGLGGEAASPLFGRALAHPWHALLPAPAMMVGAAVASRRLRSLDLVLGAMHGLLLWGVALVAVLWMTAGALLVAAALPEVHLSASDVGATLAASPGEHVLAALLAASAAVLGGVLGARRPRRRAALVVDAAELSTLEGALTEAACFAPPRPAARLPTDPRRRSGRYQAHRYLQKN